MTIRWLHSLAGVAIPVYQRDYRWTQSTCEQLLRDISAVADADSGSTHFIGSILVVRDGDEITLVDGQQRVTTLMLLLAALAELASDSHPDAAATLRQILLRPDGADRPKLRPHNRHAAILSGLLSGTAEPSGDSAFEANYQFFVGKVGAEWSTVLRGLERLEHVTIELGARANAQQTFESLNATGARLSDDELIHNYIHMGRSHAEQVTLEEETWIPIEESTDSAISAFWRDYLVWSAPEHPDLAGEFGVYRAFRDRYPDPRSDLTAEIRSEWVRFATWYGILRHPSREPDPDIATQLRLVRTFEGTPRPLLLGMYDDHAAGRITKDSFLEALERLQSLFIRRALVGLPRDLRMIGTLCRELRTDGYPLTGLVRRSPEDPQVRLALTHTTLPNAGYVLARLQRPEGDLTDLQIEHIYPQSPRDDWSGDGGATTWGQLSNDQQADFRTRLNTIGNLTLLEAHLNQGAGNRPFRVKAAEYYPRSRVPEVLQLAKLHTWDDPAIRARTRLMVQRFLEVWPRGGDAPMDEPDDLVRVVDLPRDPWRGYPELYEYATFRDAVWGDVHTVKQLVVRIAHELWTLDPERLRNAPNGGFVVSERTPRKNYERLPSGFWLYTGWAHRYLLEVAQEYVTAFGLEDEVRVRLRDPAVLPD